GKPLSEMGGPKEITNVFKARNLTANGPASYGFASMGLLDVQFVDVVVVMWDGTKFTNRTLVLQASDKNWYAMPRPDLFPLLSIGLNSETDSVTAWDE
ncbi:MAG: hypothetical protein JKY96_04255, partial [Phycisphaerales bacterium]|nr:hypothetical protein [Phycisphaerales bacterium]